MRVLVVRGGKVFEGSIRNPRASAAAAAGKKKRSCQHLKGWVGGRCEPLGVG